MFSDDIEIEISLLQNVSNIGVCGGDGEGGVGGYCSSCYGVAADVFKNVQNFKNRVIFDQVML